MGSKSVGFTPHKKTSNTRGDDANRWCGRAKSCETSTILASPMSINLTWEGRGGREGGEGGEGRKGREGGR